MSYIINIFFFNIGDKFFIENQLLDHDLSLRVRSNQFNSLIVDAVYVDASAAKVGIFTTNRLPAYTLDVEGDIRATGNLIVQGTQTTLDTVTLRVEDKNIELGYQSDSTGGDDVGADGGGVTLLSTDSNKEIKWLNSTDSWTFNKNIDLSDTTKSIKIGGQTKLTNTSLSNILYADELTRVGTLVNLQVDSININGNTISNSVSNINLTATGGMGITPGGAVTFSQRDVHSSGITVADDGQIGSASDTDAIAIASNGVVTLNALAESSSFNTDLVGGSHGHTFTATATDTFNATVEKDITIQQNNNTIEQGTIQNSNSFTVNNLI